MLVASEFLGKGGFAALTAFRGTVSMRDAERSLAAGAFLGADEIASADGASVSASVAGGDGRYQMLGAECSPTSATALVHRTITIGASFREVVGGTAQFT